MARATLRPLRKDCRLTCCLMSSIVLWLLLRKPLISPMVKLNSLNVKSSCSGGGVHRHGITTGRAPLEPEKVKDPFWQGIAAMVTVTDIPGDNVPFVGLKLTLSLISLLAVQLISPWEAAVSLTVTVHLGLVISPVHWLLVESKLVGLTVNTGGVTGVDGMPGTAIKKITINPSRSSAKNHPLSKTVPPL